MSENFSDFNTEIIKLRNIMQEFVEERNWQKYHQPKELTQALIIEASELLELFLWNNPTIETIKNDEKLMNCIKSEIADVFAYLISLVNSLDIDLTSAFLNKMVKNREKYPKEIFKNQNLKKSI